MLGEGISESVTFGRVVLSSRLGLNIEEPRILVRQAVCKWKPWREGKGEGVQFEILAEIRPGPPVEEDGEGRSGGIDEWEETHIRRVHVQRRRNENGKARDHALSAIKNNRGRGDRKGIGRRRRRRRRSIRKLEYPGGVIRASTWDAGGCHCRDHEQQFVTGSDPDIVHIALWSVIDPNHRCRVGKRGSQRLTGAFTELSRWSMEPVGGRIDRSVSRVDQQGPWGWR